MTGQDMERNRVRYELTCYSASGSGATSDGCGTTVRARRGVGGTGRDMERERACAGHLRARGGRTEQNWMWKKKETWQGGDRDGQDTKKIKKRGRGTHSLMLDCPGHGKKKRCQRGAVYNWSVHGESERVWALTNGMPRAMWHWEQWRRWQLRGRNASGQDTGRKQASDALTCLRGQWYHSRGL